MVDPNTTEIFLLNCPKCDQKTNCTIIFIFDFVIDDKFKSLYEAGYFEVHLKCKF